MAFRNHFVIKGRLNDLNDYTDACRKNAYAGAKMKMGNEQIVRAHAQNALLRSHLRRASKYPVVIDITWYEKDARRDFDNITFAQKFILDSLVQIKVLKDDSRKFVKKVNHDVLIDKENPRIEVVIKEAIEDGEQDQDS